MGKVDDDARKRLEPMKVENPSGFLPVTGVGPIKWPCCACIRLDEWPEAKCRKECEHFPGK